MRSARCFLSLSRSLSVSISLAISMDRIYEMRQMSSCGSVSVYFCFVFLLSVVCRECSGMGVGGWSTFRSFGDEGMLLKVARCFGVILVYVRFCVDVDCYCDLLSVVDRLDRTEIWTVCVSYETIAGNDWARLNQNLRLAEDQKTCY